MKKSLSLKLIVFSLLLVTANITYSEDPEFKKGSEENTTVAGVASDASGWDSSAFGYNSLATGMESLAAGYKNTANGQRSSSVGWQNSADGGFASSVGYGNKASKTGSSAFGYKNTASGEYSSAFGHGNTASGWYSSTFGSEYKVTGTYSGAFGHGSAVFDIPTNQYKYYYINEGNESYMIGNFNKIASGSNNNFILGNKVAIEAGVQNSVVLGNSSASGGSNTVSVGSSSNKRKIVNVADGTADSDAATLGQVKNLIASGGGPDLTDDVNKLKTDMTNVKNDVSDLKNDMTDVKGRVGTLENDVSDLKAGMSNVEGKITNVEGKVNTLEGKVGNLETNIAGKADVDASNLTDANVAKWRNKLKIADGAVNSATGTGSTGLGVDNTVTGNYSTAVGYKNKVTGNKSGAFGDPNLVTGNGSYAFGNDNTIKGDNNFVFGNNVTIESTIQNSVALGNNSTVSSSNEVSVGSATLQRKITNVADGEVSATSTDAVTGKQLYAMQNSSDGFKNEVNKKIDNIKGEVREVGSLSAALAGLHPMQYDPKAPAQVMAALGQYKNKQSVAVGLSYYFNDRFMMSAGVALSGEKKTKSMANVGFTVKLGKGSGVSYNETPQYVVQNEVKRLTVENQDLKSQVNNQGRENQELKAEVNSLTIKTKEQDAKIKNLEEKLNMLLKNK